ncbi:hypothetical protein BDV29DRAFT_196113 [Aspergillus leporis]|uniref:Protein kinase domain-containing protein n=1 Tax=Aspergillus leporis TaxID=41062 RepID=A0A5N5WHF4_9EURO|nr:hypothetical protein BDV29DRAFT_196113 [Aspergillus leporis]
MGESSKRQTILPEKLWGDAVRHETPESENESTGISQSLLNHYTQFVKKNGYHTSYNIDQAGPGVIALKDVEGFTVCLIKVRRIRKSWRFQAASHKNLISFLNSYDAHGLVYLVYEYEHLAISLGCMVERVLSAIVYVHSELRISHGVVDCSNVLLTWKGEVKLGTQDLIFAMS